MFNGDNGWQPAAVAVVDDIAAFNVGDDSGF